MSIVAHGAYGPRRVRYTLESFNYELCKSVTRVLERKLQRKVHLVSWNSHRYLSAAIIDTVYFDRIMRTSGRQRVHLFSLRFRGYTESGGVICKLQQKQEAITVNGLGNDRVTDSLDTAEWIQAVAARELT